MNKTMKIIYKGVIVTNVLAGLISVISQNYILGLNQLLVAWFTFLYYKEANK